MLEQQEVLAQEYVAEKPVAPRPQAAMLYGKRYAVYSVRAKGEKSGAVFWNRVGYAVINRDASMNVVLDALPVDGKLHIREAGARAEAFSPAQPSTSLAGDDGPLDLAAAAAGVHP